MRGLRNLNWDKRKGNEEWNVAVYPGEFLGFGWKTNEYQLENPEQSKESSKVPATLTNQQQEEEIMPIKSIKVVTVGYIVTNDRRCELLEAINNKPKKLKVEIERLQAEIQTLVNTVDSRS